MKLLFNALRLQYFRSLYRLRIEGSESFGDRDIDAMIRFDFKSDLGRANPSDDGWAKLRARIAEHEAQQAAQVYQPASPRVAASAWSGLQSFLPRLSQAVVALFLFFVIQGISPSTLEGPRVVDGQSSGTMHMGTATPRGTVAPQISRAYEMERPFIRTEGSAAESSLYDPDVIDKREINLLRDTPETIVVNNRIAKLPAEDLQTSSAPVRPSSEYIRPE